MIMNQAVENISNLYKPIAGDYIYKRSLMALSALKDKETQRFFINYKHAELILNNIKGSLQDFSCLMNYPYETFWVECGMFGFLVYCGENGENERSEISNVIAFYNGQACEFYFNPHIPINESNYPYSDREPFFGSEFTGDWYEHSFYMSADGKKLLKTLHDRLCLCLLVINSKGIVQQNNICISEKLNKKRDKNGKQPLLSYTVVELNQKEAMRIHDLSEKSPYNNGVSFHYRRGHYALLKSDRFKKKGLIWKKSTTVGNKKNGETIKGYIAR